MTLSTTTSKVSYAGDGATTAFVIPFLFLVNGDITAVLRDANAVETTWVENTQYTLTGAGDPAGGTLTVKTTPTDYTPASGETLVVRRVVAETQGTDYPEGGAFPALAHETALDRLTMLVQQHSEEHSRSLNYPVSDSASIASEIPNSAGRASKFLAFDASGDPIASAGPAGDSSIPVSSFIETLLDDADAAAARTTLGAGAIDEADISGTAREYTKQQNFNAAGLTDGTNIAWNLDDNQVAAVTLAGNRTLDNPTNMKDGATYIVTVKQDGTGSRTLAYGSAYKWPGGTAPTLSTAASAVDILTFVSDETSMFGVIQKDFS